MTKLRLIGLLSFVPFAAYAVIACGDDDAILVSEDAGSDAPTEAGPVAPSDGGQDAGLDTGVDTGVDSGFDAGLTTETYAEDLADAMCDALSRCCFGSVQPHDGGIDGGAFDRNSCISFYSRFGFEASNAGAQFRDAGNITLDQAKADECLTRVRALTCNLPGAEFQAARDACFAAFVGTVAASGVCSDDIECVPGTYCKKGDGGTGVCTPLTPTNGNCGSSGDPLQGELECSSRQSGVPNHCLFIDFDTVSLLPTSEWKCVPPVGVGERCTLNTWCANSLCDENTLTCVSPSNYFQFACANYVK